MTSWVNDNHFCRPRKNNFTKWLYFLEEHKTYSELYSDEMEHARNKLFFVLKSRHLALSIEILYAMVGELYPFL